MIRKIIHINEEACNGCGICAEACHEGAIAMVDGKARLLREDYCDGLGDCLPACPTGAITFEEREAPAYDHAAVQTAQALKKQARTHSDSPLPGGCPGSRSRQITRPVEGAEILPRLRSAEGMEIPPRLRSVEGMEIPPRLRSAEGMEIPKIQSRLTQWPVQIKLAPVNAPYFNGCDLLIAADCSAYAYGDFHRDFIRGRVTLIGCPKLDAVDYSEKLTEIFARNDIRSVTVVRMEVPCCGGIEYAARTALENSGRTVPLNIVTISTEGGILA